MPSVGGTLLNHFIPITQELDKILPQADVAEKIKTHKVIHITHFIQMFGFSVGLVTSVVTYILNDRPVMVASCILTATTGCALIGMKDLPYLKSLEEYAELITKRVKKIGGMVDALRLGNIQLESNTKNLTKVQKEYAKTIEERNKSNKKLISKLDETQKELTQVNQLMKAQTKENEILTKVLEDTQKELAQTKKSYDDLKEAKSSLSKDINTLNVITNKARRRTKSLVETNATLSRTLAQSSKDLENAQQHTEGLSKTISATGSIFDAPMALTQVVDIKSEEVLERTEQAIKTATQDTENINKLLDLIQKSPRQQHHKKKKKGERKKT